MVVDIHLKVPSCPLAVADGAQAVNFKTVVGNGKDTPTIGDFVRVYEEIKEFLLQELGSKKFEVDANRVKYLGKMMDHVCIGGKYNRGMTVVDIGHRVAVANGLTGDAYSRLLHQCCVAGWMIEFLQAHFLVEDDIMDNSVMRRGRPCWYKMPGVSTECAINDGLIVFAWCTAMAKHFFVDRDLRERVLDALHEQDYRTTIGQLNDVTAMYDSHLLDPEIPLPSTTDYKEFTLTHYNRIVKYKTAYYTYYLPMVLGQIICHRFVPAVDVEGVACRMGEYFQIQDDFLDCFGDPAVIQKIGTDIEDKKCSWLAVTFLASATKEQFETFATNYAKHDKACVAVIKQLYRDSNVQAKFDVYEEQTVAFVEAALGAISAVAPAYGLAIRDLWGRTYQRKK